MTEAIQSGAGVAPPQPGLGARLLGVLFAPKDTFAAIAARPCWLTAMAESST